MKTAPAFGATRVDWSVSTIRAVSICERMVGFARRTCAAAFSAAREAGADLSLTTASSQAASWNGTYPAISANRSARERRSRVSIEVWHHSTGRWGYEDQA